MPRSSAGGASAVAQSVGPGVGLGVGPATALTDRGAQYLLPVPSALVSLFPAGGLRRGAALAVAGSTSLLASLLAAASADGSWCAVVGMPELGAVAAVEAGVVLERLALVPDPGPDLADVVGALVDGVDVVVVGVPGQLAPVDVRRLAGRIRQRGAVLIGVGSWPGAELRLSVLQTRWQGVGEGHGYLRAREVTVQSEGRGSAVRPRRVRAWLPAVGGGVAAVAAPGAGDRWWTSSPPGAASPGIASPGAASPGIASPGIASPGIVSAGVASAVSFEPAISEAG